MDIREWLSNYFSAKKLLSKNSAEFNLVPSNAKQFQYAVVHMSESFYGDKALIESWHSDAEHKAQGYRPSPISGQYIGYHFVIYSGIRSYYDWKINNYNEYEDGLIVRGRYLNEYGAHVGGFNSVSLGICVIGAGDHHDFTHMQKASLVKLIKYLMDKLPITIDRVIGHREAQVLAVKKYPNLVYTKKTCPGVKVSMDDIRLSLKV